MNENDKLTLNLTPLKYFKSMHVKLFLVVLLVSAIIVEPIIYKKVNSKMPTSHVYVCDNPSYLSEFDTWLKEKISWVPSYLIVKNGYIIGAFDGCIAESHFTSTLGTVLSLNLPFYELPAFQITNLNNERKYLKDIFNEPNTYYIFEIHWLTCKDCIYQDENYTQDIYEKYGTKHIYRYYLRSEFNDVLNKYKD